MKITKMVYYGGAKGKVCRLGLADLFLELQQVIFDTEVFVEEKPKANGAGVLREALDENFSKLADWTKSSSGGIDWVKRMRYNCTIVVRVGVEVQVSARSDLVIRDIIHLRNSLQQSVIDVGIIILPSVKLQSYLTDRTPSILDGIRYIEEEFKEAQTFPIVLIAVEHDGAGVALAKKTTNRGTGKKLKPPIRLVPQTPSE